MRRCQHPADALHLTTSVGESMTWGQKYVHTKKGRFCPTTACTRPTTSLFQRYLFQTTIFKYRGRHQTSLFAELSPKTTIFDDEICQKVGRVDTLIGFNDDRFVGTFLVCIPATRVLRCTYSRVNILYLKNQPRFQCILAATLETSP